MVRWQYDIGHRTAINVPLVGALINLTYFDIPKTSDKLLTKFAVFMLGTYSYLKFIALDHFFETPQNRSNTSLSPKWFLSFWGKFHEAYSKRSSFLGMVFNVYIRPLPAPLWPSIKLLLSPFLSGIASHFDKLALFCIDSTLVALPTASSRLILFFGTLLK